MSDSIETTILPLMPTMADWANGPWWEREAIAAIARGWFFPIPSRARDSLYLLRMWLTEPKRYDAERFDSGDSLMLHYFAQGDDDASLHDHPWNFRTTVVFGGYDEHLPPLDWQPRSELGPEWMQNIVFRSAGRTIEHEATDLHCVGRIKPGTFTLVRTGPRERSWGFHPPGKKWTPWRTYLGLPDKRTAAAQAS